MFRITEHQYNIIMKQAQSCYPQETGGILGGRENTILGVLPIANKVSQERTETFGLTSEDIERAYSFLVKNKLEYLGVYHTHPKGIPIPSAQDLAHHQKYLFIIGLEDRRNPALYAWRVEGGRVYSEDIKIISDIGITIVDIRTGKPKLAENIGGQELNRLTRMVNAFIEGHEPEYHKYNPTNWDASSFSTFA
ncbi:MAG: Mov34/MPN/PAD-1 family protein [Candidatus Margulisbacteria bacterium]|nr:Mov34/MPN/PAD-1 family protein [Candidatus Margulisiibacteriota bacterium]